MQTPGTAPARGPDAPRDAAAPQAPVADPQGDTPIVPDAEFDAALPPIGNDIDAPLTPLPAPPATPVTTTPAAGADRAAQVPIVPGQLPPPAPTDPVLAQPLEPLGSYSTVPLQTVADAADGQDAPDIRYVTEVRGLDPLNLTDEFNSLSALREGKGRAENATQISARAREDEQLAVRLMKSLGYYDGTAISTIENIPPAGGQDAAASPAGTQTAAAQTGGQASGQAAAPQPAPAPGRIRAIVSATPGRLYTLGSIDLRTGPTVPADLVRRELPLKVGDPIEAARIQGAEANVSLKLPQQGYPFVKVGERDILLDEQTFKGDYTLPVETGPRSSFGVLRTEGDAVFDLDHLNVFPRFEAGQLYDNRLADDLREALVATALFNGVGVEPVRTGQAGPDGTERIDLLVRQTKGPARSLTGGGGFGTGEGIKLEGSFIHRNLFPPEGALILTGIAGTQQRGASATFRRSNAGRRDRTVSLTAAANYVTYDAFNAYTGTIAGRIAYDSTPIWQKKFTYAYGFELTGTAEEGYDFDLGRRDRKTYGIVALPGQAVFDQSDDLLNPTRGYRLKLNVSPEASVQGNVSPYARTMVEATGYFPIGRSIVLAGRARAGSIFGIERDDLAPSRRYYGGGGGSVRGYGFQRLGPLEPESVLVPDEDGNLDPRDLRPLGGRSLNEFSIEARYRFGDFGIVPFFDAGNAYEGTFPTGGDLRYGAGIGGRVYTNFGPLRVDVATPLNPRPGDGKIALYISIGQAF